MKLSKSYYLFIFQRTAIVTDLKKKSIKTGIRPNWKHFNPAITETIRLSKYVLFQLFNYFL